MEITARLSSRAGQHSVAVATNGREQVLTIPPKSEGLGSAVNGGELLFLALATCYCNDIYREAGKLGIEVVSVHVEVRGEFGGPGDPARRIAYNAAVDAKASRDEILHLMRHTDTVAEIHNTLRAGAGVFLAQCEARTV